MINGSTATVDHDRARSRLEAPHTAAAGSRRNSASAAASRGFSTYGNRVDLTAVSADTIAYVQVGGVVAGHVLGVTLAHEQALRVAPRAPASDQLPLVVVMVMFTFGGLGLLFGF